MAPDSETANIEAQGSDWTALLEHLHVDFISARLHRCRPEWGITGRVSADEMLHLVHQGRIEWTIGSQQVSSQPGDLVWCPRGVEWSARRVSPELVHVTVVHFEAVFSGQLRYFEVFGMPVHIRPQRAGVFGRLMRAQCLFFKSAHPARALKLQALIFDLLHELFAYRGTAARLNPEAALVMRVVEYLQQNLHRPLTRAALAREFHLNAHSLAALFQRYTGQSPIDYLIRLRLEHARLLLRTTRLGIAEIAERCGYEDAAYFSRLFKQKHGLSPLQYRVEQQQLGQ